MGMKYGLNNWPRVASLLVRKTSKQCKARWYDWLDPSVKKTEWSREEDEKLLHLAKLFPMQWRTIAPIVGRTAIQCLEHYERLLDQAQGREEMPDDDPRKLKPGEVDPNPHTKPARADAVDMDEDEKEMLQEARARLANTRGKKAKRKAREKALEEARRLAALQKYRELKAAGIERIKRKKRYKKIDYGTEIPFEQKVPAGFHETGPEEDPVTSLGLRNMSLAQLDNRKRHADEQRNRKDDDRKIKRLKKDDLPKALEMINKVNDPHNVRKSSKLILPAPQLQDWELEHIAKVGEKAAAVADGSMGLVQSYGVGGQTPFSGLTPGATPRTPQINTVMNEAKNAISRNEMQTPLKGDENPDLYESDFTGVLPKNMRATPKSTDTPFAALIGIQTPGKTPGKTPMTPAGLTPRSMTPESSTPMQGLPGDGLSTPGAQGGGGMTPRDALSLNEKFDTDQSPFTAHQNASISVKNALSSLPRPENEVELIIPGLNDEDENEDLLVEDEAVAEKKRAEEEQRRLEIEKKRRSSVLQRDLPRPYLPQTVDMAPSIPSLQIGEEPILLETKDQIARDAFLHPIKRVKAPKTMPPADDLPWGAVQEAQSYVAVEARLEHPELAEYVDMTGEFIYVPRLEKYQSVLSVPLQDQIASLKADFEQIKTAMSKDTVKLEKLEAKIGKHSFGHVMVTKKSAIRIEKQHEEKQKLLSEISAFSQLQRQEEVAVKSRLEELSTIVREERERNERIQKEYVVLRQVREELEKYLE